MEKAEVTSDTGGNVQEPPNVEMSVTGGWKQYPLTQTERPLGIRSQRTLGLVCLYLAAVTRRSVR